MGADDIKITGLYGCSCHPFSSWEECDQYHNQILRPSTPVRQRHTGKTGTVDRILERGFVIVKYGPYQSDLVQEHVANLENLTKSKQLNIFS